MSNRSPTHVFASIPRCVYFAAFEWISLSVSKREFTVESIDAATNLDETAMRVLVSELSTNATWTCSSGFRKILHGTVNNRNIVLSVSIRFKSLQTHRMHNLHIHLYVVDFQPFLNSFHPFTRCCESLSKLGLLLVYASEFFIITCY